MAEGRSDRRPSARSDLSWGLGAQILQYGAALLLLPILAARISSAELGLWYDFMTIQSLVLLLDLGFGASLGRSFSYVFAGASTILRNGIQQEQSTQPVDLHLLSTTIRTAQMIYGVVALMVALLLAGPATVFVTSLGALATRNGVAAWALYATAIVFNVYFQWYLPLMLGSGKVRESYKATVIVRGGFALLAGLLLLWKPVLWVVSAAYLASVLLMLIYAARQTSDIFRSLPILRIPAAQLREKFVVLWHNSYRMGLVSVGAFLITKYSVLLISSRYGLAMSASYAITLQVFAMIATVALVPFNAMLPRIATLRLSGGGAALKQMLASAFVLTWLLAAASSLAVMLFGRDILAAMHAKTTILGSPLLALVAAMVFLEINHGAAATVIASSNRIPFVPAALISGVAICALSTLAADNAWPLWTIVAIQALIQLAYNNWKWPLVVYLEYRFSRTDFTASARRLAKFGRPS